MRRTSPWAALILILFLAGCGDTAAPPADEGGHEEPSDAGVSDDPSPDRVAAPKTVRWAREAPAERSPGTR